MRTVIFNPDLAEGLNVNLPSYFSAIQTLDFSPAKTGLDTRLF